MRHIHMHVCVLGAHSIAGVFSPLQNLIVLNMPNNAMASIVFPNGIDACMPCGVSVRCVDIPLYVRVRVCASEWLCDFRYFVDCRLVHC